MPSGDDISKVRMARFTYGSCCTSETAVALSTRLLPDEILSSPFCEIRQNN